MIIWKVLLSTFYLLLSAKYKTPLSLSLFYSISLSSNFTLSMLVPTTPLFFVLFIILRYFLPGLCMCDLCFILCHIRVSFKLYMTLWLFPIWGARWLRLSRPGLLLLGVAIRRPKRFISTLWLLSNSLSIIPIIIPPFLSPYFCLFYLLPPTASIINECNS
jgi:hypothetical protein